MNQLEGLIDPKLLRIIQLFLDNKSKYFHLTDIGEQSNVAVSTTFRLLRKLVALGLVDCRLTGKLKLYTFKNNQITPFLEKTI